MSWYDIWVRSHAGNIFVLRQCRKKSVLCIFNEINIDIELANFGTTKSSQYARIMSHLSRINTSLNEIKSTLTLIVTNNTSTMAMPCFENTGKLIHLFSFCNETFQSKVKNLSFLFNVSGFSKANRK